MLKNQSPITDGFIILDQFTLPDVDAVLAGEDEEHARRFGWHPARSTRESVASTIRRWMAGWEAAGSTRAFAARLAAGKELIGGCEVCLDADQVAGLSYWTFPEHRGRRYATRIVNLVTHYAFESLNIRKIQVFIEPDNYASLGVARSAGFQDVGTALNSIGSGTLPVEVVRFTLSRFGDG